VTIAESMCIGCYAPRSYAFNGQALAGVRPWGRNIYMAKKDENWPSSLHFQYPFTDTAIGGYKMVTVTWTGTIFIVTTHYCSVLTSIDGMTWSKISNVPYPNGWENDSAVHAVVWPGANTILHGNGTSDSILISADNVSWTSVSIGFPVKDIIWDGRQLVAVGGRCGIATSTDGAVWTRRQSPYIPISNLKSVTKLDSQFVAVGDSGKIYRSTNAGYATSWTLQSAGTTCNFKSIVPAGNQFALAGARGTVLTSYDGITWYERATGTQMDLNGIFWTGDCQITIGHGDTAFTSGDGGIWKKYFVAPDMLFNGIVYLPDQKIDYDYYKLNYSIAVGGGGIIIQGQIGGLPQDTTSKWVLRESGTRNSLTSISGNGKKLVAVGYNGTIVHTLYKGIFDQWMVQPVGVKINLRCVIWTGDRFVAAGDSGCVLVSSDGSAWTQYQTGTKLV
jgi:photosystem II stability/assembly factor-like uncharacterized protein